MNAKPDVDAAELAPSAPPTLRKRLISAGVWSFLGRGAAIGLFFLTDAVLARALTKKGEFAAYFLATQATVFLAGLVALGSPQILSRTLRQVIYGAHPERASEVIRACSRILLVGCALGAIVFFVATPFYIDDGAQWSLFREAPLGIVVWGCLAAACLNSAFALQGLDDFRGASLIGSRRGGLLPNFAFLLLTIIAWQLRMIDLKSLVLAQIVLQAATFAYGRRLIARRIEAVASRPSGAAGAQAAAEFPHASTWWHLKEGLPFLASVLVTLAIDELDGLWVGRLTNDAATADYGAAKRLVRLITTPYVMFALAIAPFSAELLAKGEKARLQRILRAAATLVSLPMLVVFFAFLLAPGPLLALAFGERFRDAAAILQWLTLGQFVFVPLGFSSQVLLMAGRQTSLMYVSLAALVGYCLLMPWATRAYGAPGAAAVQSAAFAVQGLANMWLAKLLVGVWTPATLRPRDVAAALQLLLRRGGKAEN